MKKAEFKQKAHDVLDELIEYIDKLESKAEEIADDAKEEYSQQLNNLKEIRDNLSGKLDEYEKVADTKWDVVKNSATEFFANVSEVWKESYTKIANTFKKENIKDEAE